MDEEWPVWTPFRHAPLVQPDARGITSHYVVYPQTSSELDRFLENRELARKLAAS